MIRPAIPLFAACCLLAIPVRAARAQCPDGTPPPCAGARAAAPARVIVPPAADRARRFLILPFRNVTRQPDHEWLVEGSTTMLTDALGRWQGITVVPDERLYPALRRAGIAPGTVIEPPRVRRVAEETGGWTAVTGDVVATGGHVRVTARAWDVATIRELVRTSSEVPATGDVRLAFDSVSLRLLRSTGLDSVTPELADATTHNLDAYRAYLRGLAHIRRSEVGRAQAAFEEAVRLDSSFALAWARLAGTTLATNAVSVLDPQSPGARYVARALALSSRLPARQRERIQVQDAEFRFQMTECRRRLEALVASDTNDAEALQDLAVFETYDPILVQVPGGQRPRASWNASARLAKRALDLDPSRHGLYAILATVYGRAGTAGGDPVVATSREPQSVQDFYLHREAMRAFVPVYRDSFDLVPAESLSAIPHDSLDAWRQGARAVARQWVERWLAAAPGEAAPHMVSSGLLELDGEYEAALQAQLRADSIGLDVGSVAASETRRMVLYAEAGRLADAARFADSLARGRYFADPNHVLGGRDDAIPWAFALHLLASRIDRAEELLGQVDGLTHSLGSLSTAVAAVVTLRWLVGGEDPKAAPRIPATVRSQVLDSALRHIDAVAAAPRLGPWMPALLKALAAATGAPRAKVGALLDAAGTLAAAGKERLAFYLANNALVLDSTLEGRVADAPWYRSRADTLAATRLATLQRFHAGSASVSAERATFEWRVDGDTGFAWNRAEVPPDRAEYRWTVSVASGAQVRQLIVARIPRQADSPVRTGTLAELVAGGDVGRQVVTGPSDTSFTPIPGATVRAEAAPGILRLIVDDARVVGMLRAQRPTEARLRFFPCAQLPTGERCVDERVAIGYP
jgi:TolB-like protein/tetratricopeptide (TPR) repeat protein